MNIPAPELAPEALLITIEPTIETVNFKEFITRLEKKGKVLFTDGYVFGDDSNISEEFGIDTSVPGGDSSYHTPKEDPNSTTVNLTNRGFSLVSENGSKLVQFIFMEQIPAPQVPTLEELAKYQAKSTLNMVTDNLNDIAEPGNTAIYTREVDGEIELYMLNHFEDPELVGSLDPATKFTRVGKNKITSDDQLDGCLSPELIFLKPVEKAWQ